MEKMNLIKFKDGGKLETDKCEIQIISNRVVIDFNCNICLDKIEEIYNRFLGVIYSEEKGAKYEN